MGAHAPLRRAVAGGTLLVVAVDLWAYRTGDDVVFIPVILAGFWLAGRIVRSRNLLAAQLAERTRELEREREERAKLAVAEERTRIARELHDVVSHTLGVIVLQAERLAPDERSARETLTSIEQSGREALAEMGRLVGMLRADGEVGEREPQPGLGRLDELVGPVRDAGIDVETAVEGDPRTLPASVDVSAYRIVQEALTNAARHSGCSRVRVLLRWEATALEIQVADDGRGLAADGGLSEGGGHGLLGIRERVALFGGVFATGRSDLGGFLLTARLPLAS